MRTLLRTFAILVAVGAWTSHAHAQAPSLAPADTTAATAAPAAQADPSSGWLHSGQSHFTAAGFVGANFGRNVTSAGVDFGGEAAYLYHGIIGGEFIADFSPGFKQNNNVFFAKNPGVNAYMANVIGAVPIGSEGMIQPFVSGGVGMVQMRSEIFNIATFAESGINSVTNTKPGGNIGGGVMWFAGRVGLRLDVRYYRAFNSTSTPGNGATAAEIFSADLLPGLDFWRTNVGIAFRW